MVFGATEVETIVSQGGPWAAMLLIVLGSCWKLFREMDARHQEFVTTVMSKNQEREDKLMNCLNELSPKLGEIAACIAHMQGDLDVIKTKLPS